MRHFMKHIIDSGILLGVILSSIFLHAQGLPPNVHVEQISESISMKDLNILLDTPIIVDMKVTNISDSAWLGNVDVFPHVEGENGELPKTYYHRQRRHEPGLPEAFPGGSRIYGDIKPTSPGESFVGKFNLRAYYAFRKSGKYTVYMETRDHFGKTIRTNTVSFEIKAPAQ